MRKIAGLLTLAVTGAVLAGCVVREETTVVDRRPMYEQPVQTEVVAEPVIVDYATVAPPAVITEYVFINGGYYYYHPERRVFVRVVGVPPQNVPVRRISSWNEHPMYAQVQHVAPPPRAVVAGPAPRPNRPREVAPAVVVAPPVIVESSAVVAPRSVSEYVLLSGKYYYYHPDRKVFVHVAVLPRGATVHEIHAWNEHPMYDKVEHVTVRH